MLQQDKWSKAVWFVMAIALTGFLGWRIGWGIGTTQAIATWPRNNADVGAWLFALIGVNLLFSFGFYASEIMPPRRIGWLIYLVSQVAGIALANGNWHRFGPLDSFYLITITMLVIAATGPGLAVLWSVSKDMSMRTDL